MLRELNLLEMELVSGGEASSVSEEDCEEEGEEDIITVEEIRRVEELLGNLENWVGVGSGRPTPNSGVGGQIPIEDPTAPSQPEPLPPSNPLPPIGETPNPNISPRLGVNVGSVGDLDVFVNRGPRVGGRIHFR